MSVTIPEKLFFKIGEVCDLAGVQAHVLRYWETEFPMLAPQKNRAGQRTYRRRDVEMALRIKELLYDEQYTIAGAKKRLANEIRGVNRESSTAISPKAPTRSLRPPPSLAAKFVSVPATTTNVPTHGNQRPALREMASQLREILDMLDESDEKIASLRAKKR